LHAALDALLLQGKVLTPKQEDRQLGGESSISLGTVAMEPSDALIWPFPKAIRIRLSVFKELKLDAIYDKSASAQGEYSWTIGER
ncbi:MAG: hypothetical protein NTX25_03485, partial [Proteobacteria bacterium]|nr:hypothetical protein [Pseudomonadota bacterium]